jgi:hypothetical protein
MDKIAESINSLAAAVQTAADAYARYVDHFIESSNHARMMAEKEMEIKEQTIRKFMDRDPAENLIKADQRRRS